MLTCKQLETEPTLFKNLTGVGVGEFNQLLQKLEPIWLQLNYQRLDYPNRQRCIGGGPDFKLQLQDRCLMTLMLLHLQLNTETLGYLFEVNKSTVSRNVRYILPVLRKVKNGNLPRPPKRGTGKRIQQVLQEYPNLLEISDVSELLLNS